MKELPSSWNEVTIWHKVVYHTFMPMLILGFGSILSAPVVWYIGLINFGEAIVYPWCVFMLMLGYISLLGDYVMPAETYRKYRSGEWDNS